MAKKTTHTCRKAKANGEKIVMITAYDYPSAKIYDELGVDMILVGDSLGNVVLGYDDTTKVTMDDMIHHIKAVVRGTKDALVIGDMPFLSYHTGVDEAVRNAGRLVQEGGCTAVKLEGGEEIAHIVRAITNAGIPVIGHIGLQPQSVHQYGGYFIQGKGEDGAARLLQNAKALAEAGAFAVVLECVPAESAKAVTENANIITIGIGAGNACDGQVLVSHDLLRFSGGKVPSFVKQFADVRSEIEKGVGMYIKEVKDGSFPDDAHSF